MTKTVQTKSKKRITDHGEVFTSEREVIAMLNLVQNETERLGSRFLEPACGTGNFLVEILSRKLQTAKENSQNKFEYDKNCFIALSSIYAIDILEDNVLETKTRIFDFFKDQYFKTYGSLSFEFEKVVRFILDKNIVLGDALTLQTPKNNPKPIVFSEWSFIKGYMVKRRDFTLDTILKNSPIDGPNLFSDLGSNVFFPKPLKEFELFHFMKVWMYD